ncbi:Ankyrin repeat protein [Aphelenchoides besseyi]|nr:Ankyrin repeat protein [Aphelenchoides besseyi]
MVLEEDEEAKNVATHHELLQNRMAIQKNVVTQRREQLRTWESSEMNKLPAVRKPPSTSRVKFQDSDIFFSACVSGDEDEVEDLLEKGANVNTSTIDGVTALHQAVIDCKFEMVQFLVTKGADINAQDNEGWTPLHAAVCCGNISIIRYLCEKGADITIANSDKELAVDLAEDDEIRSYLEGRLQLKGVSAEECRAREERVMMRDCMDWIRTNDYLDRPHQKTGATALHVAASKGYNKLIALLVQAGADVHARDFEGWTPLHAAAYWGEKEACRILITRGADITKQTLTGQDVLRVADSAIVEYLQQLNDQFASARDGTSVIRMNSDDKESVKKKDEHDENVSLNFKLPRRRDHSVSSPPPKRPAATVANSATNNSATNSNASPVDNEDPNEEVDEEEASEEEEDVEEEVEEETTESENRETSEEPSTASSTSTPYTSATLYLPTTYRVPGAAGRDDAKKCELSSEQKSTSTAQQKTAPTSTPSTSQAPGFLSSLTHTIQPSNGKHTAAENSFVESSSITYRKPRQPQTENKLTASTQNSTMNGSTTPLNATRKAIQRINANLTAPTIASATRQRHVIMSRVNPTINHPPPVPSPVTSNPPWVQPWKSGNSIIVGSKKTTASTQPRASSVASSMSSNGTNDQAETIQTSNAYRKSWQTPPQQPAPQKESEAERKAKSRLQRASRRSTQGVTLEQLSEAAKQQSVSDDGFKPPVIPRIPPASYASTGSGTNLDEKNQNGVGLKGATFGSTGDSHYKSLYEKVLDENERLRKHVDELKSQQTRLQEQVIRQPSTDVAGVRRAYSSSLSGSSHSPSPSAPNSNTMNETERRNYERRINELEYELQNLASLMNENSRLKSENNALIRVLLKTNRTDLRRSNSYNRITND